MFYCPNPSVPLNTFEKILYKPKYIDYSKIRTSDEEIDEEWELKCVEDEDFINQVMVLISRPIQTLFMNKTESIDQIDSVNITDPIEYKNNLEKVFKNWEKERWAYAEKYQENPYVVLRDIRIRIIGLHYQLANILGKLPKIKTDEKSSRDNIEFVLEGIIVNLKNDLSESEINSWKIRRAFAHFSRLIRAKEITWDAESVSTIKYLEKIIGKAIKFD